MRISSSIAFRKWSFYLSIFFSVLILFSYQNCGKVKFSVPKTTVRPFVCPTIQMNPPSNLYPATEIEFTAYPSANVQSFDWDFSKSSVSVLSGNTNPMVHSFDGSNEGVGDYIATLTSTMSDGSSCEFSESFQILSGSDLCSDPSGISGSTVGYVGEEVSDFRITFEDCFEGAVAWDMDNNGIVDYNVPDGSLAHQYIRDPVSFEYPTEGIYTVRAVVTNSQTNTVTTLTHQIDIRYRPCTNGGINPPTCACATGKILVNNQCVTPTYSWNSGSWSACSATACGTSGTQSRTVTCSRSDGVTVADSFCTTAKPAVSQICSAPACPVVNGACGTTNNSCVSGTTSDLADSSTQYLWRCLGSNGGTSANCAVNKPVINTYSWQTGAWSACSATACGTSGTQTRTVVCKRDDGVTVQDIYCTTAKPAVSQICSAPVCPVVNGACGTTNNSCVSGTTSDLADSSAQYLWRCLGSNGGTTANCALNKPVTYGYWCPFSVEDFGCSMEPKPAINSSCSNVGDFGYFRKGGSGTIPCSDLNAPIGVVVYECSATPCGGETYSWVTGTWSACSATTCGTSGTQSRTVVCKSSGGVTVADSYCTTAKPANSQACSAPACSACNWEQVGDTTYTPDPSCDGFIGSGPIQPPYSCTLARNGERYEWAGCKNTNMVEATFDCRCGGGGGDCNCDQYDNALCDGRPGTNGGCEQVCQGGETRTYICE